MPRTVESHPYYNAALNALESLYHRHGETPELVAFRNLLQLVRNLEVRPLYPWVGRGAAAEAYQAAFEEFIRGDDDAPEFWAD